jgi:hypothetical protein
MDCERIVFCSGRSRELSAGPGYAIPAGRCTQVACVPRSLPLALDLLARRVRTLGNRHQGGAAHLGSGEESADWRIAVYELLGAAYP